MNLFARHKKKIVALLFVLAMPFAAHWIVKVVSRIEPPPVNPPDLGRVQQLGGLRRLGPSYVRRVGKLLEVRLVGSPVQMGFSHSRLLYDERIETERIVWQLLETFVPLPPARMLLLDIGQFGYRNVAEGMSERRRTEIAAQALGFAPDPFEHYFPTYQRLVYLSALYDISLGFEHSPLIGCTTFTFSREHSASGGPLLARAFDFEAHEIFDEKKAVFLVRERGSIPFGSVAWPGLVGVVSGMNLEGVAVVVHGARAGETRERGEPVVHALRRVLAHSRTTDDAIRLLSEHDPMVSHIVIIQDSDGKAVAVERVPGKPPHVRAIGARAVVTNHLEGPSSTDEKNQRVREVTSTVPRRRRGEELLAALEAPVTERDAVRLLRDRRGPGGAELPLGDRRAIDALIATHGVVMNTKDRVLWVSQAPHLLGAFVAFPLPLLLAEDYEPGPTPEPREKIAADPLLSSDRYQRFATAP